MVVARYSLKLIVVLLSEENTGYYVGPYRPRVNTHDSLKHA